MRRRRPHSQRKGRARQRAAVAQPNAQRVLAGTAHAVAHRRAAAVRAARHAAVHQATRRRWRSGAEAGRRLEPQLQLCCRSRSAVRIHEPSLEGRQLARHRVVQARTLDDRAPSVGQRHRSMDDKRTAADELAVQGDGDGVVARHGGDPRAEVGAVARVHQRPLGAAWASHGQHKGRTAGGAAAAIGIHSADGKRRRLAEHGTKGAFAADSAVCSRGQASRELQGALHAL